MLLVHPRSARPVRARCSAASSRRAWWPPARAASPCTPTAASAPSPRRWCCATAAWSPSTPELSDEHLSLLGCGVTAGVGAVLNLAEVQAGSSVAVVGCGALGLWMIQGARVAGATTIVAVEPRAERRELARAVGATHALDPADGDPVAAVKALTGGRGADYALEAAGPPEAMAQALAMTRPAGTMVPAGWETLSSTVTLPAVDFADRRQAHPELPVRRRAHPPRHPALRADARGRAARRRAARQPPLRPRGGQRGAGGGVRAAS